MMKAGFYWINDKNRYGWEVIEVKSATSFVRTGMKYASHINELAKMGMTPIRINPP